MGSFEGSVPSTFSDPSEGNGSGVMLLVFSVIGFAGDALAFLTSVQIHSRTIWTGPSRLLTFTTAE